MSAPTPSGRARRYEWAGVLTILMVLGVTVFTVYADLAAGHLNKETQGFPTFLVLVYAIFTGGLLAIVRRLSLYETILISAFNVMLGGVVYWDLMSGKLDASTQGFPTFLALCAAFIMTTGLITITRLFGTPAVQGELSVKKTVNGLRDQE